MTRLPLVVLFACLPIAAQSADDSKVAQLEQDVRDLKRQVLALSRELDEVRYRPGSPPVRTSRTREAASTGTETWVDAAKWQRVRRGMSELEVLSLLGPPTSMRDEDGTRLLFYAMEIGASGYLSGGITLRDRIVTSVQTPELK